MVCGGKKSGTFGHLPSMHVHFLILALPQRSSAIAVSQQRSIFDSIQSLSHFLTKSKYIVALRRYILHNTMLNLATFGAKIQIFLA